jgi:hypothetical protein
MTAHTYATVTHMTDEAAARCLVRAVRTVRDHRLRNPDVQYRPKDRSGIITLRMPMTEPSRSNSCTEARVMHVSLPAPPWGGGFDRQGVAV